MKRSEIRVETKDDAFLRQLGGATILLDWLELPSDRKIRGEKATALTNLFCILDDTTDANPLFQNNAHVITDVDQIKPRMTAVSAQQPTAPFGYNTPISPVEVKQTTSIVSRLMQLLRSR